MHIQERNTWHVYREAEGEAVVHQRGSTEGVGYHEHVHKGQVTFFVQQFMAHAGTTIPTTPSTHCCALLHRQKGRAGQSWNHLCN